MVNGGKSWQKDVPNRALDVAEHLDVVGKKRGGGCARNSVGVKLENKLLLDEVLHIKEKSQYWLNYPCQKL